MLRQFDAFPKLETKSLVATSRGGALTLVVYIALALFVLRETSRYLTRQPSFGYEVDTSNMATMDFNLDITIAMPCHWLVVDVRDRRGDRIVVSHEFAKQGTMWPDRPACRILGSTPLKRIQGNLHITTLGHGYASWEHTDHKIMNLSHTIHEVSFGPHFPALTRPLDDSLVVVDKAFKVIQYIIAIVPTYSGRIETNQYSVREFIRDTDHAGPSPGIFFQYDIEPIRMLLIERSATFSRVMIRLIGIVGGVWVCTGYFYRVFGRAGREARKVGLPIPQYPLQDVPDDGPLPRHASPAHRVLGKLM